MIAAMFFISLGAYLACGLVFAIPFALIGAKKIDPHATHGSWGFRVLIVPGETALWPLLLRRRASGVHEPPEECNAHRLSAECGVRNAECRKTQSSSAFPSTPHSEIRTPHLL